MNVERRGAANNDAFWGPKRSADTSLDAGYVDLADEFNSPPASVERKAADDRYMRRGPFEAGAGMAFCRCG